MRRKLRPWLTCWFALVCLIYMFQSVEVSAGTADAITPELQIEVTTDPESESFGWVHVFGLDQEMLDRLREQRLTKDEWARILSVRLSSPTSLFDTVKLPNVAGRYEVFETGLRFVPHFAPSPGTIYHVAVQIDGYAKSSFSVSIKAAQMQEQLATGVSAVYPSAEMIPENTLRFYVHFSRPMLRGQVAEKIRLVDHKNQVVENAFVTGPTGELWDPDQRRLTLLFDPGRIKRGVAPNRLHGPALRPGSHLTLVVDREFKDAEGRPLGSEFRKSYMIGAANRKPVSPGAWTILAPQIESRSPLRICFDHPMDSAMMLHAIKVYDASEAEIQGHVDWSSGESEWLFTPSEPWLGTDYVIRIATALEDISGNNLLGPMDASIRPFGTDFSRHLIGDHVNVTFAPTRKESEAFRCTTDTPRDQELLD